MKKLLFFSKNLEIGGMEKSLIILLNHLCKDYKIDLILEEKKGLLLKDLDSSINIKEYKLSQNKIKVVRKFINFMKRFFWGIANKNKYDFSCNYATYSYLGSRLVQIASSNSSLYVHNNYYDVYNQDVELVKDFFANHRLNKFKNIILVSNESKNDLLKIYGNLESKMRVINNLIDYEQVLTLAEEKCDINIKKEDVNFVYIGRLDNEAKNLELMLKAFLEVSKIDNSKKLYLVGNGPFKNNIEDFIKKNKLNKTIFLVGERKNPYNILKKGDVLILTSNYEGYPVVYSEALILHKEIMTTIPTSDEVIDINDFCVKIEKNKQDIVEKIVNFKKNTKKYNFDFQKINSMRLSMIKELIEVE